jgi:hypothetical protein
MPDVERDPSRKCTSAIGAFRGIFSPSRPAAPTTVAMLDPTPGLRSFVDHWQSLRGGRRWPAFQDFDPADVPHLLPHLILFEVISGGTDFLCRLAGEEVRLAYGGPVRGRLHGDLAAENPSLADFRERFRTCIRRAEPLTVEDRFRNARGEPCRTIGAIVPFGTTEAAIDRLLCCSYYIGLSHAVPVPSPP